MLRDSFYNSPIQGWNYAASKKQWTFIIKRHSSVIKNRTFVIKYANRWTERYDWTTTKARFAKLNQISRTVLSRFNILDFPKILLTLSKRPSVSVVHLKIRRLRRKLPDYWFHSISKFKFNRVFRSCGRGRVSRGRYIRLGKVRVESTRRTAWRRAASDERTESNNGTRFVCKPSLNGRQKHTSHSPDTDTSNSPFALAHRSLPSAPASLFLSSPLSHPLILRPRNLELTGHGNQHEPRQIRTPHTDIRGFIWGLWLEGARKRPRQHRVVLPPVTGTPTTTVETHFKVAGCVAKLIRLLSDFANWGRG